MLADYNARTAAGKRPMSDSDPSTPPEAAQEVKTQPRADVRGKSAIRERDLHDLIIAFCNGQWPRWKFIHARMDQKSTVAVGAQDFTIFAPGGECWLIECKRPGSKMTTEQLAWKKEMDLLGWNVATIYDYSGFLDLVKGL